MKILIAALSLSFTLASNINAGGDGTTFYERLSAPLIVIIFGFGFIFLIIIATAVYFFFVCLFRNGKE